MELIELLQARPSKKQILKIADNIIDNDEKQRELLQLIQHGNTPIPVYGSWLWQHIANIDTTPVTTYVATLLDILQTNPVEGVRRCIIRSMQDAPIPPAYQEAVIDRCFQYLEDGKEAIAVKAFSMTILHRLCKNEPELLGLLADIIEMQLPTASAAIKSRGNKILRAIRKEGK